MDIRVVFDFGAIENHAVDIHIEVFGWTCFNSLGSMLRSSIVG